MSRTMNRGNKMTKHQAVGEVIDWYITLQGGLQGQTFDKGSRAKHEKLMQANRIEND